jgi:hypothetical protein
LAIQTVLESAHQGEGTIFVKLFGDFIFRNTFLIFFDFFDFFFGCDLGLFGLDVVWVSWGGLTRAKPGNCAS